MSRAGKIAIRDRETIVFYGDSITQQNLYSEFIETFLLSRFPEKDLLCYNFGWGGDTAAGGRERFARDAAPVRPTLVFVNFGMNDGKGGRFTREMLDWYIGAQSGLADAIRDCGARQVMLTTSPVDFALRADKDLYNDTLAKMADGVLALARKRGLDAADIFHRMRALQAKVKAASPKFTMMPDSVHPDPVGHLVMAYFVLSRIAAPMSVGTIEIAKGRLKAARGVKVSNLRAAGGTTEFDLTLPFIPFYVPKEARAALEFLPLQKELNRFEMKLTGWNRKCNAVFVVDGKEVAVCSPERLAKGIDLALLDGAPWVEQGRALWDAAQKRWLKHYEVWRTMGFETPLELQARASFSRLVMAQNEYVRDIGRTMKRLARPRTYHVALAEGTVVEIGQMDASPRYEYRKDQFDVAFPPEVTPGKVRWQPIKVESWTVDLGKHFGNPMDCVSYLRLRLVADAACRLHLTLGSDDGITVFADGKKVLARDVYRPLNLGDDETDVDLKAGLNEFLFRITQGGGGYAFALRAKVLGRTRVRQVHGR